jgi:hypothetical protein
VSLRLGAPSAPAPMRSCACRNWSLTGPSPRTHRPPPAGTFHEVAGRGVVDCHGLPRNRPFPAHRLRGGFLRAPHLDSDK